LSSLVSLRQPISSLFPYTTLFRSMVSVIMMSCLGIAFSSGKDYYQSYIETISGDYHYSIDSNSQKTIDTIQNDQLVQEYYLSQRSEEHTSELQSRFDLVCSLQLEK